jgi:serine/threonine-protein kinase
MDRFEKGEVLKKQETSVVYQARQLEENRIVVIKEVVLQGDVPAEYSEHLLRQGRAIVHLDHPNVLPVYDFHLEEDRAYVVAQYALKGTLADRLGEPGKPVDPNEAIQIVCSVGRALGYVHGQGLIHRNIKPSNIFMNEEGAPLIGDFGLVMSMEDGSVRGVGFGACPDYAAPEQARGEQANEKSDIYSLGVVLYRLLAGPVSSGAQSTSMNRLVERLWQGLPDSPLDRAGFSPELKRIIRKATAPDPADRYETVGQMVQALTECTEKQGRIRWHRARSALKRQLPMVITLLTFVTGVWAIVFSVPLGDTGLWITVALGGIVLVLLMWLVVSIVLEKGGSRA